MKNVTLVATGGTIASVRDQSSGAVNAGLTGDALLAQLHAPLPGINVTVENFQAEGSYALELSTIHRLCARIQDLLTSPDVDGIVVTHGTDTMEESAFLAWLLVGSSKPVVFTGAQRHADMLDTDGPRNIRDAILAAAHPDLEGVGPVIAFEGELHSARYVTKAHTSRVDTFRSPGHGKLGEVDLGEVHIYGRLAHARPVLATPHLCPDVELILLGLGSSTRLIEAAVAHGAKGIVLSAFGRGNAPKGFADTIGRLQDQGIPVVLASRCFEGRARPIYGGDSGGVSLLQSGAILAADLSAVKARLLLSALLGKHHDLGELKSEFETRSGENK